MRMLGRALVQTACTPEPLLPWLTGMLNGDGSRGMVVVGTDPTLVIHSATQLAVAPAHGPKGCFGPFVSVVCSIMSARPA